MLTSIISGGAAGAERGALRAAIDLDIGYGGWRWCEDEAPEVYTSRMRPALSRAMQRRLNVQDSDATLFVMRTGSKEMKFIVDACRSMRKPAKTLVLRERRTDALLAWISERHISVLNVVGDAGEDETRDALVWMLDDSAKPVWSAVPVTFDPTNGFHAAALAQAMAEIDRANASMDAKQAEIDRFGYGGDPSKPAPVVVGLGEFIPRQDTPTKQSGDACSSQRIVSDGATPSPDTCGTCGAKPGGAHPGSADDFDGACPKCGAWAAFTEGGTDA